MHLPFARRSRFREVERCYLEYAPALLAYARSFGLNHAAGEDLVQRIFLTLLENETEPREWRPYLFRALRNAALNLLRGKAREVDLDPQEPWFTAGRHSREAELDLRRALRTLPPEQNEVLLMHVWGGLSFEEVSTILEISPNTVAARYRYALKALKRKLAVEVPHDERP